MKTEWLALAAFWRRMGAESKSSDKALIYETCALDLEHLMKEWMQQSEGTNPPIPSSTEAE